jgi:predicted DNA-binding transcriptional regulator YafY
MQGDGSLILTLHVADMDEVKRWLIGFGGESQVMEPETLRNEIAAECAQLLLSGSHKGMDLR